MAVFRNLGVKLLGSLCDVLQYVSSQPLVFLDLAENCSFLDWKLTLVSERKVSDCLISPPFAKGDLGGFQDAAKIPPGPPFPKGGDSRGFRSGIG